MPLPPALAARLAKRGILKPRSSANEQVEEVIAEDYDDRHSTKPRTAKPAATIIPESSDAGAPLDGTEFNSDELVHEVLQCPNLINTYHTCSEYCLNRWGYKRFKADPTSLNGRERLLRRYPLPAGWLEVGDPDTGRYYYWNSETDEVSWLSPNHPRAIVTLSVERLKELSGGVAGALSVSRDIRPRPQAESDSDSSTDLDDEKDDNEQDFEEMEREFKRKMQSERDRGKDHRRGGRGGRVDDSLDPMDPAAYSDVPRGSWKTGMETNESAKTGADVTAAGPLFQQRPYPSPGAVLRMNKGGDKK